MRGWRGILGGLVGLSVLQMLLSTSQGNGNTARVNALFTYPTQWLDDLADPTKPGLPQSAASKAAATQSSATTTGSVVPATAVSPLVNGLSNVPTTSGTGSNTLPSYIVPT